MKIVLGPLEQCKLLDKDHHIYMDNYYTSPELAKELYYHQTYYCGTVKMICKYMPKTLGNANIQHLQSVFSKQTFIVLEMERSKNQIIEKTCYYFVYNTPSH